MTTTKTTPMINANYILEKLVEVMSTEDLIANIKMMALKAEDTNEEENKMMLNNIRRGQVANGLYEIISQCHNLEK